MLFYFVFKHKNNSIISGMNIFLNTRTRDKDINSLCILNYCILYRFYLRMYHVSSFA